MSRKKSWAYYILWIPIKFVLITTFVAAVAGSCVGLTMILWNDVSPKVISGGVLGPLDAAKLFLLAWFLVALPAYLVINAGSRRLDIPDKIHEVKDIVIGGNGSPGKISLPRLEMPKLQGLTKTPNDNGDEKTGESTTPKKRMTKVALGNR